jgi:Ca2+-binding RTX toxin-like protein
MVYDIATLQAIYGVDTTTNTDDNVYRYGTTAFYDSIWDAGGVDTIDLSATTASNTVKLVSGSYSTINYRSVAEQIAEDQAYAKAQGMSGQDSWIAKVYNNYAQEIYTGENALGIAFGAIIENVKGGSAADTFYDNAVDNVIYGGSGDDVFYLGAGGYDTLYGETGVDKLILSSLAKSSVQLEKQATGETFLLASNFEVKLVGIETIQFSDQTYTV